MRKKFSALVDIIFILTLLTIGFNCGCDIYYHFRGDKVEKSTRFCSRLCWNEFDTDLMNVGVDGQRIICNCKTSKDAK